MIFDFFFFICTFNFLQLDMREEKFVWMKLMKKNLNVRILTFITVILS